MVKEELAVLIALVRRSARGGAYRWAPEAGQLCGVRDVLAARAPAIGGRPEKGSSSRLGRCSRSTTWTGSSGPVFNGSGGEMTARKAREKESAVSPV